MTEGLCCIVEFDITSAPMQYNLYTDVVFLLFSKNIGELAIKARTRERARNATPLSLAVNKSPCGLNFITRVRRTLKRKYRGSLSGLGTVPTYEHPLYLKQKSELGKTKVDQS